MTTKLIPINQLNFDEEVRSIRPIDQVVVSRYRQAARTGADFPPIIVDKKDKSIVSGHHRIAAFTEEFGVDHKVYAIFKSYRTKADKIEEAVRENATHGNPLDGISRNRAAALLQRYGRSKENVASILGVSVERIEVWGGRNVVIIGKDHHVPVKKGIDTKYTPQMTDDQYIEHIRYDRGVDAYKSAEQLTRWIGNGYINMSNQRTAEAMTQLHKALEVLMLAA